MTTDDLPIALRRTRRSLPGANPTSSSAPASQPSTSQTPRKAAKRKVRFSDPGPSVSTPRTTTRHSSTTGLTPMMSRTLLGRNTPSTSRRRRHSTPACGSGNSSSSSSTPSGSGAGVSTTADLPTSGEVHFLPLRQVLSGRVQRRIRRNGLSEEMNAIAAEKRRGAKAAQVEVERLRQELRQKDAEIYELQNATVVLDTERIWALEREVDTLRAALSERSAARDRSCFDWTLAARGPFADDFSRAQFGDETAFGDATAAELVCSTPSRVRSSFLTPPLTSPVAAAAAAAGPATTPSSRKRTRTSAGGALPPAADVGVQACFPDPDKRRLEEEVASARLEMSKLTTTLASYSALADRLSGQLSSVTPLEASPDPLATIESQVAALLRSASDRAAALRDVDAALCGLGFPGADASEVIASLSAALRTARLELEYLTPGEVALPLSSHGGEVLDLLLARLRGLARRAREDEASIDEYHELELSLRQQLGARVAAMRDLDDELRRARAALEGRGERVAELEVGVERLKGAAAGYARDVAELEGVVGRMEGEHRDAVAARDAQEDAIAKLEGKLADALAQGRSLRRRLKEAEEARARDVAEATRRGGLALAVRDARVRELREEVDRVNAGLRAAHEGIKDLRVEKRGLEAEMVREREAAKAVIDGMRGELERVVGMSREFLGPAGAEEAGPEAVGSEEAGSDGVGPVDGASGGDTGTKRGLSAGGRARRSSGRKKRRFDSGLGFLDEDEVDA
ncbi:hypothetical protein LY76DRAFT_655944 [Colletotrichum caudatum]|nr:hypothetical protein LY76DRAFT_655944 [Colletotrichum caudatum]